MKNLSYEAQKTITKLYGSPSLWGKIFPRQGDGLSLVAQIEQYDEPMATPFLLPLVFSTDKTTASAIAKTIHKFVSNLSSSDLIYLDQYVRRSWFPYYLDPRWDEIEPKDISSIERFGDFTVSLLGLCSFHRSGYVREEAIKSLGKIRTGIELTFLLIRLNDWVPNVRNAAYSAVEDRLFANYAPYFIKNIRHVLRLVDWQRENHTPLYDSIIELLQQPDCTEALAEGMQSDDILIKRTSYQIAIDKQGDDLNKIVEQGLKDNDQIVRLRIAQKVGSILDKETLQMILPQLKANNFMPVRREALHIIVNEFPEQALGEFKKALLDNHASIRDEARFEIAKTEDMDFASYYRDVIAYGKVQQIYAAIGGLGETGKKEDDEIVIPFAQHRVTKIRKASIRALARLNLDVHADIFLKAMQDISAKVSREATEALKLSGAYMMNEQPIWEMLASKNSFPHTRGNTLSLLACLTKWQSLYYLLLALTMMRILIEGFLNTLTGG